MAIAYRKRTVLAVLASLSLLGASVTAATAPPPAAPPARLQVQEPKGNPATPAIVKVAPGIFRMGEITIDKNLRSVIFPAQVNMEKGLLEYLLVRTGGKTHESLLRTDLDPYQLQLAFLLIGYEGSERPLARQGDPASPTGEPVEMLILVEEPNGSKQPVKPQDWVEKRVAGSPTPANVGLVYTGSVVHNNRFMAQAEGSVIALYHDPAAIIDNASPGGESDKVWFAKAGKSAGTPVSVVIRSLKRP